MRRWTPRNQPERVFEQLVLPHVRRRKVLELAHRRPLAGHLGQLKMTRRILRNFYWLTLFRDVKEFCEQCPECQLTTRNKNWRTPLIIIGEPFERIAMDIVGPLPKTSAGHQFILVVSDYATRFPEAFPLRRFTAAVVPEKLLELFTRHGIPKEILTDQGTNFTSCLLKELYKMLGVKSIRTTPYHPSKGWISREI